MVETCIHCGKSINTHCRCSETCTCGKPISRKVKVIAKLSDDVEFTTDCSSSHGYQGMFHYENRLVIDGYHVSFGSKDAYIDNDKNMYILN